MNAEDPLRELGRGMTQLHVKVGRVLERLERSVSAPAGADTGKDATLEPLLDLLEAAESTLQAAERSTASKRRWWQRRPDPAVQEEAWLGLRLALEAAKDRMRAMGIEPTPQSGALDPELHRAIAIVPNEEQSRGGCVATTHRHGWWRRNGDRREVLRTAQISVYQQPQ